MKFLAVLCALLFSIASFAKHAHIDEFGAEKINVEKLAGKYINSLGYETKIELVVADKQGDLFEPDSFDVYFGDGDFEFFTNVPNINADSFIDPEDIRFRRIAANGDVIFTLSENCSYNTCLESQGSIIFRKKANGGYWLDIQLETLYWDYEQKEVPTSKGAQFCAEGYPKVITSKISYLDGNLCEAKISVKMKKESSN